MTSSNYIISKQTPDSNILVNLGYESGTVFYVVLTTNLRITKFPELDDTNLNP